jgi:hypothetical protein
MYLPFLSEYFSKTVCSAKTEFEINNVKKEEKQINS